MIDGYDCEFFFIFFLLLLLLFFSGVLLVVVVNWKRDSCGERAKKKE